MWYVVIYKRIVLDRHTVSWNPVAVFQNKNWAQMLRRDVRPGLDQQLTSNVGEEAERKKNHCSGVDVL